MNSTLSKEVLDAMRQAGIGDTSIERIKAKMLAKKRAVKLGRDMIRRIELVIAEHGAAVVTAKRVFNKKSWAQKQKNGATHLHKKKEVKLHAQQ